MTFKMSDQAQTINVFNFSSATREFIGTGDAYVPPHTGLPAFSTVVEPPGIPIGSAAVFDDEKQAWQIIEDYRGLTVFSTATGAPIAITDLGPLPDNTVLVGPSGPFEIWDGTGWVKDKAAEAAALIADVEEEKNNLMHLAGVIIEPLQDAVDLDIATEEEEKLLFAWKKYRVDLRRVNATKPVWPDKPE